MLLQTHHIADSSPAILLSCINKAVHEASRMDQICVSIFLFTTIVRLLYESTRRRR